MMGLPGAGCFSSSELWRIYPNLAFATDHKYCSLPAGAVALILLYIFMPAGFPHTLGAKSASKTELRDILVRIDYIGAILLFGASVCFVAALEEAGTHYEWSSATIIVLLVLSALLAIGFLWWEHSLNDERKTQEAVFSWRLLKHRVFMGSLA